MRSAITIHGLREPACLAAVERVVLATRGVTGLDVHLDGGMVVIDFDESVVDEADLRTRIGRAHAHAARRGGALSPRSQPRGR